MDTLKRVVTSSCMWCISHIGIKSACDLEEEVSIMFLHGVPHIIGEVYELKKALYSLKQALVLGSTLL